MGARVAWSGLAGAAVIAATIASFLGAFRSGPDGRDGGGDVSAGPSAAEATSSPAAPLGAVPTPRAAPPASAATRVSADARAPLPAEVEAAFTRVVEAGRADGRGLRPAIADFARVACLAPDAWRGVLARVLAGGPALERGERAALLALTRCGREDVLRPLAALVADATTPAAVRASLALGLGQLRTLDAEPHGRAAEAHEWPTFDDATLGAPIAEPFVVDALLACLEEAPRPADGRARAEVEQAADAREAAAMALAGTAAAREDVFARLVAAAARDATLASTLRVGLRCAGGSPWVAAWAREQALGAADGTPAFAEAFTLWATVAPQAAAEALTALLRDPATPAPRKAASLAVAGACVRRGASDGAVEELARAADAFAEAEAAPAAEGAPAPAAPEGAAASRAAADALLLAAVAATGDRSFVLRERAVEAALRVVRAAPDGPRPPAAVAAAFARGDRLALAILYRLRDADLPAERLADAVDAALDAPASRGSAAAAVEGAIAQLLPLLPDDVRAAMEARRAARAAAIAPAGR